MFVHLLEKRLSRYVERLELELSHMETGEKTVHGENRSHLAEELMLMKRLSTTVEEWNQTQMRTAIDRMDAARRDK